MLEVFVLGGKRGKNGRGGREIEDGGGWLKKRAVERRG